MVYNAREYAQLRLVVYSISLIAWLHLLRPVPAALSFSSVRAYAALLVTTCSTVGTGQPIEMLLVSNPPSVLVRNWGVMLIAMMAPLLTQPLYYIQISSFARRRFRSLGLFVAGYAGIWLCAGVILLPVELAAKWLTPQSYLLAIGAGLIALVWQTSPWKQRFLNRCHRHRPLAVFGLAADWDVLCMGLDHGLWCTGSCWALMLFPLLLPHGHFIAMAAVGILMFCERLDPPRTPAWRWRGFGTAFRYLRLQLWGPRQGPVPAPLVT